MPCKYFPLSSYAPVKISTKIFRGDNCNDDGGVAVGSNDGFIFTKKSNNAVTVNKVIKAP